LLAAQRPILARRRKTNSTGSAASSGSARSLKECPDESPDIFFFRGAAYAKIAMSPSRSTSVALFASTVLLSACGRGATPNRMTHETTSGGDVAAESPPAPSSARWISDANALSLASTLNARAIAAADFELENWHVDTARAFAASMAREHADLQHSIDSLTTRLNVTPVSPALAKPWMSAIQAQIDTVRRAGDAGIDLAFVRQQANSHALMADYLSQLATVAERPELQAFLQMASAKASSQGARARALQPTVAKIDSTRREAARKRATTP
jgi:predicted outer membrane protein